MDELSHKDPRAKGQQSRLLDDFGDFKLWVMGYDRLPEFTEFIYRVYYETRSKKYNWQPTTEKAEMQADSDIYFPNAKVCAVTVGQDDELVGTWGLILKDTSPDDGLVLPIMKRFELQVSDIKERAQAPDVRYLFNGWRTAVDKNVLERHKLDLNASIRIFDMLLRGINEDFEDPTAHLGVAEMENLVLRYHRRIGVPWQVIGEPRTYWGNTKFPCAFRLQEYETNLRVNHPERYAFVYQK